MSIWARNQCLKCGSRELKDISRPVPAREEPGFTDAAEKIVHIMGPYFTDTEEIGKLEEDLLVAIGKSLYDKGEHSAMLVTFKETRNLAHRRFGYTGTNRRLEMIWSGIGEWRG